MEQIVTQLINACACEFKKEENQSIVKHDFINPLVHYIGKQIWPYVLFASILFVIIFTAIFACLFMLYMKHSNFQQLT